MQVLEILKMLQKVTKSSKSNNMRPHNFKLFPNASNSLKSNQMFQINEITQNCVKFVKSYKMLSNI